MSFIHDEKVLIEMRKNAGSNKAARVNSFKIGENIIINQGYDHSTDIYNPYFVNVYVNGSYKMGGSSSSIALSIEALIKNLIKYSDQYQNERNDLLKKFEQIITILDIERED